MGYVGAPYNFVPFGTKIYRKAAITKHNEVSGLSGYLEYQVTAQTPIMVDCGDGHFYKNKDGKAAIPGSTMHGLVRSNMQVLSQSAVVDDIANAKLMYRCVGGSKANPNKKEYDDTLGAATIPTDKGSFSVLKNVRGGYISCKNGRYYIIPPVDPNFREEMGAMNYYVVSERTIIENGFKGFEMFQKKPCVLQNFNTTPFEITVKEEKRNVKGEWKTQEIKHYKGRKNTNYKPYYEKIYYRVKGERRITALSETMQNGYKEGTLITTGFMNEKKAFYVIPKKSDIPESEWIPIPPQDIDSFKRDFEGRKNQLTVATGFNLARMQAEEKKALKAEVCRFFNLPEPGEMKPVFYIELEEGEESEEKKKKLYFGFTPRLRLFYDKEIYDGLSKEQRDSRLDYCKALFGFASETESYRSRLSFREAVIDRTASETEKTTVVLGEPKPTSYLDYLTGKGGTATYRGDFFLRGMKQYWLHSGTVRPNMGNNKEVGSAFYPYPQGTSFTGQIRFTNLSEEELGMLLWSLLLEKESQQNIGKGKPYGYGRIRVSLKQLNILDTAALYGSDSLCLEPYQDQKNRCSEYVEKAKQDMTRFLGKDVMTYKPIQEFFWMKNADEIPEDAKTHYMSIDPGYNQTGKRLPSEYQERTSKQIPLDTIGVVMGKEKKKPQSFGNQGVYHGNRSNSGQNKRGNGGKPNWNDQNKRGNNQNRNGR